MRKRILCALVTTALFTSSTVFAAQTTVPIESLQPATHLVKPPLNDVGGKLIFSDSPETIYADSFEGAFYRDQATGEFRVFWHHQNESGVLTNIAVAITNNEQEPVQLFSEGVGVATQYYPDVAGQAALAAFMQSHTSKKFVALLAPGESYYLASPTANDDTTSGIAQFTAVTQHGNQPATVMVTTLSYHAQPENPTSVAVLGPDSHVRGSFPHFDRTGTLEYNTEVGNAYIDISSAPFGQWSDSLPGEYEAGVDVVDGNQTVYDDGNYGVLYDLQVKVTNEFGQPRTVEVLNNPAGGGGHFVVAWNQQLSESDYLDWTNAWQFASFVTGASGNQYQFQTSLTGGSAGPQRIYLTNSPMK